MRTKNNAPNARNGPKGILTDSIESFFLSVLDKSTCNNPYTDPRIDPIVILIQQPIIPVNDPIKRIRSKSPSPMPFILRIYLKMLLIENKKKYPNNAPEMLPINDNGNNPYALITHPKGTRKIVTKREMSIVSISDRIVTINAEKNKK